MIGDGNDNAGSNRTEAAVPPPTRGDTTDGQDGPGAGNQTDAGATAPVEASGNQVTVIGDGNNNAASNQNGSGNSTADSSGDTTDGQDGAGAGNQTDADATAPVQASGNQVTVIGDGNANTRRLHRTEAGPTAPPAAPAATPPTARTERVRATRPTPTPPHRPRPRGNQVTVIGDGNTAETPPTEGGSSRCRDGDTTNGEDGKGAGNQTNPPPRAPVDAGDNQVTVIGDGNTSETPTTGAGTDGSGGDTTDGADGTGSGQPDGPGIRRSRSTPRATRSP